MIIFHSDIDNTLIYSYRHDIGRDKICVEWYEGREVSFMTPKSLDLLRRIHDNMLFVPTTTRTILQYNRIDFGLGVPDYALVCNGGVLLENGKENVDWYQESLGMIRDCTEELRKAEICLWQDENRIFEVRNIKELFIFTKSSEPVLSIERLRELLNLSVVDVFHNGGKVYVVPKKLSKGIAVQRFRRKMEADMVIAAGDSAFDVSMLNEADISIMPEDLQGKCTKKEGIICAERERIFSDYILEYLVENCI